MDESKQVDFPASQIALPAPDSVEHKFESLYRVLALAFVGVIVANVGLSFLLIWQTRITRGQLESSRQAISRFQRLEEPLVKEVVTKLDAFGLQYQDYQAVLRKYPGLFPRYQNEASGPGRLPNAGGATIPASRR